MPTEDRPLDREHPSITARKDNITKPLHLAVSATNFGRPFPLDSPLFCAAPIRQCWLVRFPPAFRPLYRQRRSQSGVGPPVRAAKHGEKHGSKAGIFLTLTSLMLLDYASRRLSKRLLRDELVSAYVATKGFQGLVPGDPRRSKGGCRHEKGSI